MSISPLLFENWWEKSDRLNLVSDVEFCIGLYRDHLLHPTILEHYMSPKNVDHEIYLRCLDRDQRDSEFPKQGERDFSEIIDQDEKFQIVLDMKSFKHEEIIVKTFKNFVIVEAKHKENHEKLGHVVRDFSQKYKIPKKYEDEKIISKFSCDGILTIYTTRI